MKTVSLEVSKSFFKSLPELVYKGILTFKAKNIPNEDLAIFMPSYITKMLGTYMYPEYRMPAEEMQSMLHGIKIIDGYENAVIISYRDNIMRNIDPVRIEIN